MRRLSAALSLLLVATAATAAPIRERADTRGQTAILAPAQALSESDTAELASKGVVVRQALTNGRYLVRVADGADVSGDPRVISLAPLTAEQKIDRTAFREVALGRPMSRVNVLFHRDVDFDAAREAILEAGGELDPFKLRFSPSQRIEARIPAASLVALAGDERVLAVAGPRNLRVQSDNAVSAQISHVTELYSAPYNLTGAGVTVSLFELAAGQATHPEFGGRLTVDATGGSSGDKQHATHVAGTIAAAGVRADAKGMAPAAKIYQFCIQTPCGGSLSFLDDKDEKLAPLGIVVDNNSWGFILGWTQENGEWVWNDSEEYFGAYDAIVTAPLDEISIDKKILFVHSAGNDAEGASFGADEFAGHRHTDEDGDTDTTKMYCYSKNGTGTDCPATVCPAAQCETVQHHTIVPFDTIGLTAAAKNVITVGAITQSQQLIGFSSRGPAKDGRVKPDVVARGFSVLSSVPTDSYTRNNGTSMAAPAVTGIAALLTEQWRKTFAGASPLPAQLKALIIAGTDDLGNPGPDYSFGFGLANAKNAADLIIADGGNGGRIRTMTFAQGSGQSQEVPLVLSAPQNLRVVLHWPDPATPLFGPDDLATTALVNDLDVRVVGPDGTTHSPWVLDKNTPSANATKGVNTVDNTEMLDIPNAPAGTYRVIVTGTRVTDGPQDAVLVANAAGAKPCSDIQEPNNESTAAYGNLVPNSSVNGAICSAGDADFFKFNVTRTGAVSVTVTAGDTPLRVTLTGNGISRTQDIAANETAVLNADANSVPNQVTLKIESTGTLGANPSYTFTPRFGEVTPPRRRSSRH